MANFNQITDKNFLPANGKKPIPVYADHFNNLVTGENTISADIISEKTSGSGVTADGVILKDGTIDINGTADGVILDADGDTTISSPTDDQIDVEVGGSDVLKITSTKTEILAGHEFDNRTNFEIFDDFTYQTLTEANTPWILNSGADAQAIDPAINSQASGVVRVTTGDADGTTANDGSQLVCAIPVQASDGGLVMEARLHINTAVTDISVFVGLTDSTSLEEPFTISADTVTSTASDAVGFLYDTSATTDEWWMLAVDSDTDDAGNAALGVAPTADVYQTLRLEVSADGATINFYIGDTLVNTLSGDAGVSPDVNLYATIIACSTTTTQKTVDVDYIYIKTTR